MPKNFDLSIIIISYGTKQITLSCLKSIYQHTLNLNFEVIVVDNNSPDDSATAISQFGETQKDLTLIQSDTNLGFGKANNLAASKARGKYLLFLNSDTLLTDNNLPHQIYWLDKNRQVGVLSCQLVSPDGSLQPAGGFFPTMFRIFVWQFFLDDLPFVSNLFKSIHPHQTTIQPDWVTGAFMMIPRLVFEKVGGFDPEIFMYTEEIELCYRIKKAGFTITFQPDRKIIHIGRASGGSLLALTYEIKYMIYFFKKHKPNWQLPLIKLMFWFGSLLRLVIFGIIGGDVQAKNIYSQALRLNS